MSNHFTGLSLGPPLGDQRLDLCDLYAFQSPADSSRTVLILNANPNADALHPDAIYRLAIDNDGDLQNDIAFSYVFSTPQDGRQTVDVYLAHGDDAKEPEAVGEKIFDAVDVSFGKTPDIHQSGRLHLLRGRAQRCVLLRLRRHQEPVRHLGHAELHVAASCRTRREIAVDGPGFQHRPPTCSPRCWNCRPKYLGRDPDIRIWGRCSLRQDGKLDHVDRAGHPSVSSFFNTDDTKLEYNASEPVRDRERWIEQFIHLMGHTGGYSRDRR